MILKVNSKAFYSSSWLSNKKESRKKYDLLWIWGSKLTNFLKKVESKGSEQKTRIGNTILVKATNNYKDHIGKLYVYKTNYTKDTFIMILNCDY